MLIFRSQLLTHDVGIKPNISGSIGLAINSLCLAFKAREGIAAALEHLQIFDHRASSFAKAFAWYNGCDSRGIHYEKCSSDASFDLVDRQVIYIITYEVACRFVGSHRGFR